VRSASVFAGPCHFNGELTTTGGEAMFAIAIERGSSAGVDLKGVSAAALVSSETNLKLGAERKSLVYVSANANEAQRASVAALLSERSGGQLGEILAVEPADVRISAKGEAFQVDIGDRVHLDGVPMPDRACCKMPNQVWYEPLLPLESRVVGFTRSWSVDEPRLGMNFERAEENSAFLGVLGDPFPVRS
jgi:hypothetical protein